MEQPNLDSHYWSTRYRNRDTPWDAGAPTTPITQFFDSFAQEPTNLQKSVLIPGAGVSHEAAYIHRMGFNKVLVCDWAVEALKRFEALNPNFPKANLLCEDFFQLETTGVKVDLMVEQTFFCAIEPALREKYVATAAQLLFDGGLLVGLLFDRQFPQNPPFGGSEAEYRMLFEPYFDIKIMEKAKNSIEPRQNSELFVIFKKKSRP